MLRGAVTIEYQRQRAKEMRKYFEDAKLEQLTTKTQCVARPRVNGHWASFLLPRPP